MVFKHVNPARIDIHELPLGIGEPDHILASLEHGTIFFFRCLQVLKPLGHPLFQRARPWAYFLFQFPLFGNVGGCLQHVDYIAPLVFHRSGSHFHLPPTAIFKNNGLLAGVDFPI